MQGKKNFYEKKKGQITNSDYPVLHVGISSLFNSFEKTKPMLGSKRVEVEINEHDVSTERGGEMVLNGIKWNLTRPVESYPCIITLIDKRSKSKCVLQKCVIANNNPMKDVARDEGVLLEDYTQPIIYRCVGGLDENGLPVDSMDSRFMSYWRSIIKIFIPFGFDIGEDNTYIVNGIEN